jgi:hypothetical protein
LKKTKFKISFSGLELPIPQEIKSTLLTQVLGVQEMGKKFSLPNMDPSKWLGLGSAGVSLYNMFFSKSENKTWWVVLPALLSLGSFNWSKLKSFDLSSILISKASAAEVPKQEVEESKDLENHLARIGITEDWIYPVYKTIGKAEGNLEYDTAKFHDRYYGHKDPNPILGGINFGLASVQYQNGNQGHSYIIKQWASGAKYRTGATGNLSQYQSLSSVYDRAVSLVEEGPKTEKIAELKALNQIKFTSPKWGNKELSFIDIIDKYYYQNVLISKKQTVDKLHQTTFGKGITDIERQAYMDLYIQASPVHTTASYGIITRSRELMNGNLTRTLNNLKIDNSNPQAVQNLKNYLNSGKNSLAYRLYFARVSSMFSNEGLQVGSWAKKLYKAEPEDLGYKYSLMYKIQEVLSSPKYTQAEKQSAQNALNVTEKIKKKHGANGEKLIGWYCDCARRMSNYPGFQNIFLTNQNVGSKIYLFDQILSKLY